MVLPPYVSQKLREWLNTLEGREQLAAQRFADGMPPGRLAEMNYKKEGRKLMSVKDGTDPKIVW